MEREEEFKTYMLDLRSSSEVLFVRLFQTSEVLHEENWPLRSWVPM